MSRVRAAAVAAVAVLAAGCGGLNADPAAGRVAARDHDVINNVGSWALFVAPDGGGEQDKVFVKRDVYRRCPVGSRWPDCRNKEGNR